MKPTLRTGPVPLIPILFAVLAACAEDHADRELPGAGDFREWDSAAVRIVESPGEALATVLPWEVDTMPNLELGEVDGAGPTAFESIAGIVSLPDGGLVVLDAGSRELRWFDASGEHLRTTGGRGQGPGEFLAPSVLPHFRSDTLAVYPLRMLSFREPGLPAVLLDSPFDQEGLAALGPRGRWSKGIRTSS